MRTLLTTSCILFAACGGGETTEPDPELEASMQIGVAANGSEGFATVEDGADTTLSHGGQGGFHVWTAPRFRGAMGTVYLDREARLVSDGTLVLRAARLVIDVPEDAMESWWHDAEAFPSFMCPTPIGIQAFDAEIEFNFELRNEAEDLIATDSLVLVPRCPPGEDEAFCQEICGGL